MPSQEDIQQQQRLLKLHRQTLSIHLEQYATLYPNIPPGTIHGILEARSHVSSIKKSLRSWGVQVEDLPIDEDSQNDTGSDLHEQISIEHSSEQRVSKQISTDASSVQEEFIRDLLKLIDYAKKGFNRIKGKKIGIHAKVGDINEAYFSLGGSTQNQLISRYGSQYKRYYTCIITDNTTKDHASIIFESISREIVTNLPDEWEIDILDSVLNARNPKIRMHIRLFYRNINNDRATIQFWLYTNTFTP